MGYSDNSCLNIIARQLEQINKNLEKIANNTEKVHTTGYMRTELNKGEFIGLIKKEFEPSKIGAPYYEGYQVYCDTNTKQNKDSYVDKNIILD